jgi:hypothetical protein
MISSTYAGIAPFCAGVFLSDDVTFPATLSEMQEQPLTKYKFGSTGAGNKKIVELEHGFDASKFFSLRDVQDARYEVGAAVTGTPSEQAYFIIFAANGDGATSTLNWVMHFRIEYDILFSEPKALAQS